MKRIGIDTNVFMSVFLAEHDKLESSLAVIRLITDGTVEGIVSSISLVEVAVLFYQKGEEQKAKKAVSLMTGMPNTTIVDVTSDMALDIALLKTVERLSIADATILSAAMALSADVFLTYDTDFSNVKKIPCMKPDEYLKIINNENPRRTP